jgi:phosphatidylglycerophosphatase A
VKELVRLLATLGPVGYFPVAPATAASAVTALVGYFLPVPPWPVALLLIAAGAWLAIGACGAAEQQLGHDAKPIVADEVVGQTVALLFVEHNAFAFLGSFILFRVFDVWKPLGANQAQRLPGGLGVVMDDVIAGLTACGVLHLGLWGAHAAGWIR